ncbi:MAG: hypothetical protein VX642_13325 [Bdellovibrionota bacterium]|nr:hypothetical protein [Bdellovibrionota bacterium]
MGVENKRKILPEDKTLEKEEFFYKGIVLDKTKSKKPNEVEQITRDVKESTIKDIDLNIK